MGIDDRKLDQIRGERSELENHYIDELVAGRLDRRSFLRRGAVLGMSASVMGAVLAACGGANSTNNSSSAKSATNPSSSAAGATKGGTLKLASTTPATALNPLVVQDAGGLCMLGQTGEFLTFDNNIKLQLEPMLATSWKHNGDGTVWTFTLRKGVKFHNGAPMTADDVVYTFQQLSDTKNASNALSSLGGVLKPSGVKAVDSGTVQFTLEAANGNFPYLVSSDNYNAIIVPKGTDYAKWDKTFIGTGAFKLGSYSQGSGATFTANPDYWGGKPNLDGTAFSFYSGQQPQILALQGGTVDVIVQFVGTGAQSLLNNSQYTIITLKSSSHRELSMRNDQAPFTDARVRQAIAYSINRPALISTLLLGQGQLGNDSPFAPLFPSTDTSVPQRAQDIAKAKSLLSAAGHGSGFNVQLDTEDYEEIPQLAQLIQADAKQIGVNINLKVEQPSAYFGKGTFGNSDWLDATMSLVDYGDRGVPNVFLESTLSTGGTWNAAHFSNKTYDKLVKQYIAAADLQTQKQLAGKIQTLLLQETPLIIPYFIDGLTASKSTVHGLNPTSTSQIFLRDAYITT
jgi:peptide/nickel transport system substrate-binding protein